VALVRDHCRWEHAGQAFFSGEVEPCSNGRTVTLGTYFDQDAAAARPALDTATIQPYGCIVQIAPPDFDRVFGALADHTRRDIVRRAINADEGVVELASHYPMSFAAVQKHVAVLERAGLVTKERIGRRKVVRTNLEALRLARRLLDQYEQLWRGRIDRMAELIADTKETDR
jgi:DNA-binding transcriptional ArsR family regulator